MKPLNYCTSAIEELRALLQGGVKDSPAAEETRATIALLDAAQKFILPDAGVLIDTKNPQSLLDVMRLPFPVTAFEYTTSAALSAPREFDFAGVAHFPSPHRIALCWEPSTDGPAAPLTAALAARYNGSPPPGIFIHSLSTARDKATGRFRWNVAGGCAFLHYGEIASSRTRLLKETQPLHAKIFSASKRKGSASIPIDVFPWSYADAAYLSSHGLTPESFEEIVASDCADEIMAAIQACAALSCSNVSTETIEPSRTMNKIRRSKGKQPFYSYRLLHIDPSSRSETGSPLGGSHASPRTHLRRGHIRTYHRDMPNQFEIWINSVTVRGAGGFADKDYVLHSPGSSA